MSRSPLVRLSTKLYHTARSLRRREIYCITDQANWIFSWIGHYVTTYLKQQNATAGHVIDDPHGLRNQIIHFIDRYAYLNDAFRYLHPSNVVILSWFHGDPAAQSYLTSLAEAVPHLQKIVVSHHATQQALQDYGVPASKLVLIPLGVDLSRFAPTTPAARLQIRADLQIPENAICIGSFQKDGVGWGEGLEPKLIKGPDIFLEVVANLSIRYKNLMILLTGPARGYVKQGLEQLGVPYIHHFLTDYRDIGRYYQALDLYIIPARCEGGPASLLESWATGVPLVSTRMGMPADLIRHGLNGMLAEVEDVTGLTGMALELIENEAQREYCRRQALEDVKQYDWPLIANRYYVELYQPFLRHPSLAK
jgi:glycosyltransferase involved in cell wall biosynthesis